MKTKLIAIGLCTLTAIAVLYYPGVRGNVVAGSGHSGNTGVLQTRVSTPPKIEVVFVLDTTGSMSGLIQAAKDKIWSIASTMASAQPAPEISIGLVAYRDRGDDYITRVVDLSDDLDSVYASLIDFEAAGGGDGPESVNQALHDAVRRISWSQDPDSYQVVFLVGDAPAHMDYPDEVQYPVVLAEAARRGIVVNAIRCGDDVQTEAVWRSIAAVTQGAYFSVDQSGSAIAMNTPYDGRLAELSAALDDTRLYYGNSAERASKQGKIAATDKLHAKASVAAKARRATFNVSASGAQNLFGDRDLVAAVAAGEVVLGEMEAEQLPEPMQSLSAGERDEVVRKNSELREDLKRQIVVLSGQRAEFLEQKIGASEGKEKSLDHRIFDIVKEQAGKRGFEYAEAPRY